MSIKSEDPQHGLSGNILLGGEDAMEEDEDMPTTQEPVETSGTTASLIDHIVTPSPYAHHQTGPTAARFRNALGRVTTHPTQDIEAWQALITEVKACYRNLSTQELHAPQSHAQLDWMESVYGTLLKYFPYASTYYVTIVEMLLAQSARVGEEEGPLMDYGSSARANLCQAKLETIFHNILGIPNETAGDGNDDPSTNLGGMCTSSVELWLLFVRKRIRDAHRNHRNNTSAIRQETIQAYEMAIEHAGSGINNHLLWKQYLSFVKSWNAHEDPVVRQQQMLQLRGIYQRLVLHPMTGLDQLWQEYEALERSQNEQLAAALIGDYLPKYKNARGVYLERNRVYSLHELQIGRLATPPVDVDDDEYASKLQEEGTLLNAWYKRTAYERTNPESLTDPAVRIRQVFKEMVTVLTRHLEAWHMWSMWELHSAGSVANAVAVLALAQTHIPDSTLLAYAQAQLVERHTDQPTDACQVLKSFLERSPNTLGYCLYQQMVRRHKGIAAARAVFAEARRVLQSNPTHARRRQTENDATAPPEAEPKEETVEAEDAGTEANDAGKRWMVTNRLDSNIGNPNTDIQTPTMVKQEETAAPDDSALPPGLITWHLYASHASIEHRLNRLPKVAARVYELGLRKHRSFLTKPAYVYRYAQLLLELQDTINLRALLTRAVAAATGSSTIEAELWDMTLEFESILSAGDPASVPILQNAERQRRAALLGPDVEDVCTGGLVGATDVGGQSKSTISEQLIRLDGYDASSNIVNGLGRTVEVLGVMGLWGSRESLSNSRRQHLSKEEDNDDENTAGSKSDASYQRRLTFQSLASTGVSAETVLADGGGSKILSARERLQQTGAGAVAAAGPTSAATLMIQQSPEWLRPLLMLLPASRLRTPLGKPPLHLTEMALQALRMNPLPADRPSGTSTLDLKRKRGGDSSDEEETTRGSSGYGSQFRARQRARQMASGGPAETVAH